MAQKTGTRPPQPSRITGALVYPHKTFTKERLAELCKSSSYTEVNVEIHGVKRKVYLPQNVSYVAHDVLSQEVQDVLEEKLRGVKETHLVVMPMSKNPKIHEDEKTHEIIKTEQKEVKKEEAETEETKKQKKKEKEEKEAEEKGLTAEREYVEHTYKKLLEFADHLLHNQKDPEQRKVQYEQFKHELNLFWERLGLFEAASGEKFEDPKLMKDATKLETEMALLGVAPRPPPRVHTPPPPPPATDETLLTPPGVIHGPPAPVTIPTPTGHVSVPGTPTTPTPKHAPTPKGKGAKLTAPYVQRRRWPNEIKQFEKYFMTRGQAKDFSPMAQYYNDFSQFEKYLTPIIF